MRGRWSNAYFRVLTQFCALCAELKCHSDAETIIGINILFDGGMLFFSEEDPSENIVLWDASDGQIEMTIAEASSRLTNVLREQYDLSSADTLSDEDDVPRWLILG